MYRLKMEVLTAVAAWAVASSCLNLPVARQLLGGICARDTADLGVKLSSTAKIYQPGTDEFVAASTRWSNLNAPTVNLVVVPGTEQDVAETVSVESWVFTNTREPPASWTGRLLTSSQIKFANEKNLPFLAYNGVHGAITTLGRMQNGIEIYLNQLSGVEVSEDGKSARIGGGTRSKLVTDTLWAAGKQTGELTLPCR